MHIAIFDYLVTPNNPAGSCHRLVVERLAGEHEFTVFASHFENPHPARVRWIRVPALARPLAALFVTYHVAALLRYAGQRLRRARFALVQSVESNLSFGDVVYAHFCHRWFLKNRWRFCRPAGARGVFRWLDHALHAALEPWVFRRARWIVAPSRGLARELAEEYPRTRTKLRVIANPVDLTAYARPTDFNRQAYRARLGVAGDDPLIVFAALGHFERKGLPFLLAALSSLADPRLHLCVVGGAEDVIAAYRRRARDLGLRDTVSFAGHQRDIRPYLWSADLFALPSLYETFSLVALEAAAAGCPAMVSRLNGVEDYLSDGVSCLLVDSSAEGVRRGLDRFLSLPAAVRCALGESARAAAQAYGVGRFVAAWREFYREIAHSAPYG